MQLAVIEKALGDIRGEIADFEPGLITSGDAAKVFAVFIDLEKAVSAGLTMVAARASEARDWEKEGHRSPAHWLAEKTGSAYGTSAGVLETSERLVSLPETNEALRRGELSGAQVREITATAIQNPQTEGGLLKAAKDHGLKGLKEECLRTKARALSEKDARARYEEIRKNRSLHMWTDQDGVGRIDVRLAPDDFARVFSAIGTEANAVFAEARKAGHRESGVAYAADALVALVTGTSVSSENAPFARGGSTTQATSTGRQRQDNPRPTTTMHLRVDLAALKRGELEDGECCEIPGIGPVPLATARNVLGDSFLKVIIGDAVDVTSVCHLGRAVPAHIRSALEDRDEKCVVPGCDVAKGLEIDHYRIAFENDGPTELWNLCRLCHFHHYLKPTHCGYAISGKPGSWEWTGPESERSPVLRS
jgi:hypothetical protein